MTLYDMHHKSYSFIKKPDALQEGLHDEKNIFRKKRSEPACRVIYYPAN
jgi:hypothetical protein